MNRLKHSLPFVQILNQRKVGGGKKVIQNVNLIPVMMVLRKGKNKYNSLSVVADVTNCSDMQTSSPSTLWSVSWPVQLGPIHSSLFHCELPHKHLHLPFLPPTHPPLSHTSNRPSHYTTLHSLREPLLSVCVEHSCSSINTSQCSHEVHLGCPLLPHDIRTRSKSSPLAAASGC